MGTKGTNNRLLILQAADHLFHVRGYNQTSFSDISDETGIPRGNFYYYFKTKEDILAAVVDSRVKLFRDMLEQCDMASSDPLERLVAFVKMPLNNEDGLIAYGCPVGSMSAELAKDAPELQDKSREVFEVIRDWMAVQFGTMGIKDGAAKAMDLLARMQGTSIMACTFKDREFLHNSISNIETWLRRFRLN